MNGLGGLYCFLPVFSSFCSGTCFLPFAEALGWERWEGKVVAKEGMGLSLYCGFWGGGRGVEMTCHAPDERAIYLGYLFTGEGSFVYDMSASAVGT
ncbi:hypothetical protein K402DRAFT_146612 [Aulographum hederae CBS 113979]|uniref:Uncharacterized protein n=1 Tax=Aulographum hederae CBS 113979 TaxID=1176131 RepID=A0A6G1GTF3_9PEZI|nr:hypothetical protein K402DRAFT_146612 [Aulographum hederae CBS 113979]